MTKLYEMIENLCKENNINVSEMCRNANVPRGNLTDLKMGRQKGLSAKNTNKIANFFGVSVDYLLNGKQQKTTAKKDDGSNAILVEDEQLIKFPVIGSISAGYTGLAVEEYTGEFQVIPSSFLHGPPENYFILHVKGDSMYPRLLSGDCVLVKRAPTIPNGKVGVVLYNGDEATVKKINYDEGKSIELIPFNPEYQTKHIEGEDLNQCKILGEVVMLLRKM